MSDIHPPPFQWRRIAKSKAIILVLSFKWEINRCQSQSHAFQPTPYANFVTSSPTTTLASVLFITSDRCCNYHIHLWPTSRPVGVQLTHNYRVTTTECLQPFSGLMVEKSKIQPRNRSQQNVMWLRQFCNDRSGLQWRTDHINVNVVQVHFESLS